MLVDGIYKVSFGSNVGMSGQGLVTISNGSVNGGDFGYLYQGAIKESSSGLEATLNISQHDKSAQSVFGSLTNFTLVLGGTLLNDKSFNVSGAVAEQPGLQITINGSFLKPLV